MNRWISIFGSLMLACTACRIGSGVRPQFRGTTVRTAVSSDSVPIQYEVRGRGPLALVFIHGWACDRTFWSAQMEYFARHYRVAALDLGGHGDSGAGRRDWTVPRFAADARCVLDKLRVRRVVLVGHSLGGLVALEAARHARSQVVGVVGIDAFHDVELKLSPEQIAALAAPFRADFVGALRQYARDNFFTTNSPPSVREGIVSRMARTSPETGLGAGEALFRYDPLPTFQELRIPILCLNSDRMPTQVEALRRRAASFDFVLLTGRGHFSMIEDPETVNRLLAGFVQQAFAGSGRVRVPPR